LSPADARALIAHASLSDGGAQTWADLGCGSGTFTVALVSQVPPRSVVHAMDVDIRVLKRVPSRRGEVEIATHVGDFTEFPWPFDGLDGVLMANALHYVRDQAAFLRRCDTHARRRRVLLVEYDTDQPNQWVPYPLGYAAAVELFRTAGYDVAALGRRPSVYRRVEIYGALFTA
jgi:ubiquinone/menaquinone biosynthesis C-methylase UbiE